MPINRRERSQRREAPASFIFSVSSAAPVKRSDCGGAALGLRGAKPPPRDDFKLMTLYRRERSELSRICAVVGASLLAIAEEESPASRLLHWSPGGSFRYEDDGGLSAWMRRREAPASFIFSVSSVAFCKKIRLRRSRARACPETQFGHLMEGAAPSAPLGDLAATERRPPDPGSFRTTSGKQGAFSFDPLVRVANMKQGAYSSLPQPSAHRRSVSSARIGTAPCL